MKKNFKLRFYKFFKIRYCDKCLSTHIDYGYWSRATDLVYGGAHGNMGHRCFDCGYIDWKTPIEEYKTWYSENWKIHEDSPRYKDSKLIKNEN